MEENLAQLLYLTLKKKQALIEKLRQEWQSTGWYGLPFWGRQNALAGGYALYKGTTKQIVLTGGRIISCWARNLLPKKRLDNWPSEASLMLDIIKKYYGTLYFKKYNRDIKEAIILEEESTNTLENFVYSINCCPKLLLKTTRAGLLSAGHHLRRISILAELFLLSKNAKSQISAQELLGHGQTESSYLAEIQEKESRFIKGLKDPKYLTYWLGYFGELKYPSIVQKMIKRIQEEEWQKSANQAFKTIGMDINEFVKEDLIALSEKNPQKYDYFLQNLRKFKSPEYRRIPD